MIKQLAWNTFKNTGDINTFMEFMAIKNIENNLNIQSNLDGILKVNEYGDNKDQGCNNCRE